MTRDNAAVKNYLTLQKKIRQHLSNHTRYSEPNRGNLQLYRRDLSKEKTHKYITGL